MTASSVGQRAQPIKELGQGIWRGISSLKESPSLAAVFAVAGLAFGFKGHSIPGAFIALGHLTLGDASMRRRQIRAHQFDREYQKAFIDQLAGRSIVMVAGIVLGAGLKALSDYQFSKM